MERCCRLAGPCVGDVVIAHAWDKSDVPVYSRAHLLKPRFVQARPTYAEHTPQTQTTAHVIYTYLLHLCHTTHTLNLHVFRGYLARPSQGPSAGAGRHLRDTFLVACVLLQLVLERCFL